MNVQSIPLRFRSHFRLLSSGDLAYFPRPLAKQGYLVNDSEMEQRLLKALRWADFLNLAWFVLCVATLSLAFPEPPFIPALGIAFVVVAVGFWGSEWLAGASIRRSLRTVVDERTLFARYRLARFGTARAAFQTTLGYAAAALFFMYAAGLLTGSSFLIFAFGIIAIALCMLILWATESD